MPEAEERRKTPAIPPSAARSSATQSQSSGQPRTSQQDQSAATPLRTSAAEGPGNKLPSSTTSVPEVPPKADAVATRDSFESGDAADGVNWHDESSLTRYLNLGYSKKELAALASEEVQKEMGLWRESNPAIRGDLLQFLGDSMAKEHTRRMILALEELGGSDEEDDEDDEDEDEDEEDPSAVANWTILPQPQSSNSTSGHDQAVESVAEPLEPDVATSTVEQFEMKGLTFDEAVELVTSYKKLSVAKDDVAAVKARSQEWILVIMKSFSKPFSDKPTFIDFEEMLPDILKDFTTWQADHVKKTNDRLKANPKLREALATVIFGRVVERHEKGHLEMFPGTRIAPDTALSCSTRLELITAAIEKLAIVRWDVAIMRRVDDLINSPVGVARSKEVNKKVNEMKKEKYKHLRKPDGKSGPAKGCKPNATRKGSVVDLDEARRLLLEGCTFLADVDGDTDMEDASRPEITGAEAGGAPAGRNGDGDGDVRPNDKSHEKRFSGGMEMLE